MEDIELAYIEIRERLLEELSDDEFQEWIVCPECNPEDYKSLVTVLLEKNMTNRVRILSQYIKDNDKSL